jgi:hypothetical protein
MLGNVIGDLLLVLLWCLSGAFTGSVAYWFARMCVSILTSHDLARRLVAVAVGPVVLIVASALGDDDIARHPGDVLGTWMFNLAGATASLAADLVAMVRARRARRSSVQPRGPQGTHPLSAHDLEAMRSSGASGARPPSSPDPRP